MNRNFLIVCLFLLFSPQASVAQSPGYDLLPFALVDGRSVTLIDFHASSPVTWRVRIIVNPDSCDVKFTHGSAPESGSIFKGQQAIVMDKGDLSVQCEPAATPAPGAPPAPTPRGGGTAIIEWLTRPAQ